MSNKKKGVATHSTVYERVFNPPPECTLYHYCSSSTLLSILEHGKLRFSDINMMNDPREWAYAYELFERAANALLEMISDHPKLEGLDVDFLDQVDAYLSPKQLISHPVITCFSKEPDVLSQWRGYAEDGRGWSIGFDGKAIDAMPVSLLEVIYDPDQQLAEVRNFLAAMYMIWQEKGGKFRDAVGRDAVMLASFLHAYKHPSFQEEQEIRAIHELRVDLSEDGWELVYEGGASNGKDVAGEPVRFRAVGSSIVSYIDIPLQRVDDIAIRELWFGPSNENGIGNALFPLTHGGHRGVKILRSASSYRA